MKITNIEIKDETRIATVKLNDGYEILISSKDKSNTAILRNPDDDLNPIDICTEKELEKATNMVIDTLYHNTELE